MGGVWQNCSVSNPTPDFTYPLISKAFESSMIVRKGQMLISAGLGPSLGLYDSVISVLSS